MIRRIEYVFHRLPRSFKLRYPLIFRATYIFNRKIVRSYYVAFLIMFLSRFLSVFSSPLFFVCFFVYAGVGMGLVFTTLAIILVIYFDRYRGLALGCQFAGFPLSGLVFPLFLSYTEHEYGFRGALLVFGAISTHITALVFLLREPSWSNDNDKCKPQGGTEKPVVTSSCSRGTLSLFSGDSLGFLENLRHIRTLLRTPIYYVILANGVVANYTLNVFSSTIVDHAKDQGVPATEATNVIVYTSLAQLVGVLGIPCLSDFQYLTPSTLQAASFLLLGTLLLLLPHVNSYIQYVLVCVCTSMLLGSVTSIATVLMADYLGHHQVANCHGLTGVALLPVLLCSPLIVGKYALLNLSAFSGVRSVSMLPSSVERKNKEILELGERNQNSIHNFCNSSASCNFYLMSYAIYLHYFFLILCFCPAGFFRDYQGSYDNMFRMHAVLHLCVGTAFVAVAAHEQFGYGTSVLCSTETISRDAIILPYINRKKNTDYDSTSSLNSPKSHIPVAQTPKQTVVKDGNNQLANM